MIETMRRGARTRRATSVAAIASVGETIAPSVNALPHDRPLTAACEAAATQHVVAVTRPTASSEIGRRFWRRSRRPGEEGRRVEERRQDRDEHEIRRKLQVRQPGHEAEHEAAADERDRNRQPAHRGRDEHHAERGEEREQLKVVVGGERHRPTINTGTWFASGEPGPGCFYAASARSSFCASLRRASVSI